MSCQHKDTNAITVGQELAWCSFLDLKLNLSVIWRKQVVEPNGKDAHQNCHPANTVRRGHLLNGFSMHDKETL
jgi:hypothetical protein